MKPYAEMTKEELVALRKDLKAKIQTVSRYSRGQCRSWI